MIEQLKSNRLFAVLIMCIFVFLIVITFISADTGLSLQAYRGPIWFWIQFPWLFVTLCFTSFFIFLLLWSLKKNSLYFYVAAILAFGAYLLKVLLPYYLFNGLVHYDIFYHYTNVQALVANGIQNSIQANEYLLWPSTFVLTDLTETVAGTLFPVSTALLAIISKLLLVLFLFIFIKKIFGPREAVLSILFFNLVEPISIHYSPFTITYTLMIISFVLFFLSYFEGRKKLQFISLIFALSIIFFHAFLSLILSIMLIVGVFSLFFLGFSGSKKYFIGLKKQLGFISIVIITTLGWWLYVSKYVLSNFVITLISVFDELRPLVPFSSLKSASDLADQLSLSTTLGVATRFILPLIVVIPIFFISLRSLFKKRLSAFSFKLLFLFSILFIMGSLWAIFEYGVPLGFSERFLFVSEMLLVLLSGVCVVYLSNFKKFGKMFYMVLAVFFTCAIVVSPLTNSSDYVNIYCNGITTANLKTVTYIIQYANQFITLTGDARFTGVIDVLSGSNKLNYINELEWNIKEESFDYSSSAIVVTLSTPTYVTTHGVDDKSAQIHLSDLSDKINIVFNNGYDTVFIPIT